jgi:hypothetical protein
LPPRESATPRHPDPRGPISLADSFFDPVLLTNSHDLNVILKGLASQKAEEIDNRIVDAVRNFLFGPPGAGGFDLASLNIQRGRDHGLSDYNTTREAFGLARVTSFAQITSNVTVQNELASLYGTVDNIDLWVGGLAEDHLRGSSVGPLFTTIMVDQFTRVRDGDRFFFENDPSFSGEQKRELEHTTLADIIRRNTGIRNIQDNVFFVRGGDDEGEHEGEDGGSGRGRSAGGSASSATLPDPSIAIALNNLQGGLLGSGPAVELNRADKGNITASLDNLLGDPAQLPVAKTDDGMATVHKLTSTDALKADQAFDSLELSPDYWKL